MSCGRSKETDGTSKEHSTGTEADKNKMRNVKKFLNSSNKFCKCHQKVPAFIQFARPSGKMSFKKHFYLILILFQF